LLWLH